MNEIKAKNIYQRIQSVRNDLQKLNLKKSGKNTFARYSYYELGDFLPSLNKLMHEQGIMTRFNLDKDKAVLLIFNSELPEEKMAFYLPTASAEVKGANAIQQLGSQVTYLRRYLLMTAFEIAESDSVDSQEQGEVMRLDQLVIDRINASKTLTELATACNELQKGIDPKEKKEFQKALLIEYTRRKGEIESL